MWRKIRISIIVPALLAAGAGVASAQSGKGFELYEARQWRAAQTELQKERRQLTTDDAGEKMRIDYLLAQCSAQLGEPAALDLIAAFTENYPMSIYYNELRFTAGSMLFDQGRHEEAARMLGTVDGFGLPAARRDEYNYKTGYSYFMTGDYRNAASYLQRVGQGVYRPHAQYYTAYMDYSEGNYAAARRGFAQLAGDPAYERLVPFYLLQIEFLEGNYDYVTANGDALLRASQGERTAEIARILAESWFHKDNYGTALTYMDSYRSNGGRMGREENYITGYSEYMCGRAARAAAALAQVVGPQDRLSQSAAYHIAAAYLELDDKRAAMQSFSIAADGDFDAAIREDALFNYGKLQFELGGGVFNEAINVLSRYIAEYPRSARTVEAREYLASAYYNSKNYKAAYDAIKLIPDPDNNIRTAFQKISYFRAMEYYNAGDRTAAYAMLEESLRNKFTAKYTALTNFWMGEILYGQGDYDRAAKLYKEYLALSRPQEKEYNMALYNLGYAYFNRQDWAEARSWFGKFTASYAAKDSYRADALNRLGDVDFAQREFWKAIEKYDEAAKLGTPERYYAQFRRAVMLGHVDRQSRKIESLNEIITAGAGDYAGEAMLELGRTYLAAERFREAAAAMKCFTDSYPNSDKYVAALSELGLIYQNLGDDKTALGYYKTVVEKAPRSREATDAMLAIQNIYVDSNDIESYFAFAARSGVETDLSAVARDSLAWTTAERTYTVSANPDTQVKALKSYLDRYPRGLYRANALYYTGELFQNQNRTEDAVKAYAELAQLYHNDFTVRGLERLAALYDQTKRHAEAADAYKQLSLVAVNPATVSKALDGYLTATAAAGNPDKILAAANEVAAAAGASAETKREARYMKAGVFADRGRNADAMAVYRELATETRTAVGARSTLRVIEDLYAGGEYDKAQVMILDFASRNTPYRYELGRAFLVLGDIYVKKGDNFQARATLQSIIDGYSPTDDGVVEAARSKISALK